MQIALLLFDGMTALDAIGPIQVLSALPGAAVRTVASVPGAKRTDAGVPLVAEHALSDVPSPDIVLIPGGVNMQPVMADARVLEWLRAAHSTTTWTTSVCTGALVLGAAGILRGLRATTHWAARESLRAFGAEPVAQRVIRDGKVVTAAGVSAGIDMALRLAALVKGESVAQIIQLMIEYDPDPPFRAGSPTTAPPEVLEGAMRAFARSAGAAA
jgi:transcriptional regulator GlxA family with amidase domain